VLSQGRIIAQGQTPHLHEREAFEFVRSVLPDSGPFHLWAFVDLIEPGGRRYDLDFLILGTHALYLVEAKSHEGILTGDEVDWFVEFPGGGRTSMENPLRGASHKARVLSSRLDAYFAQHRKGLGVARPWVQPLVFLSHPKLEVKLAPAGRNQVVTREQLVQAVQWGKFQGASSSHRDRTLNNPQVRETLASLKAIGLRQSTGALKVEGLHLGKLLEDGSHFQDHLGVHESIKGLERRVRSFLVPASATAERREQLMRAARREAEYLNALSDHKGILRLVGYLAEAPHGGPCVILEHIENAQPLDSFLRAEPNLSFDFRLDIIRQVAEALGFCHRKQVLHRGLNPRAILVSWSKDEAGNRALDVRLYNFQLASSVDSTGTFHLGDHGDPMAVYQAPEVLENPAMASPASDVFSLGAVAYLILTGNAPGTSLAERAELMREGYLSLAAARNDFRLGGEGKDLEAVFEFATTVHPSSRADDAVMWLNILLDAATSPARESEVTYIAPGDARPGDHVAEDLEVKDVLGSGSTARVLRVKRGDEEVFALKVALSAELDERLSREAKVLAALKSERIVALVEERRLGERVCLLLTDAGESLAASLSRDGPPSLDFARRWGDELFQALEALEERGIQHRDIKPANLGVLPWQSKKKRSLLLFDFSLTTVPDGAVTAGTPAYRDPFLHLRGSWDAAADRWSAAITLHEMLTGSRPIWGDEPAVAAQGEIRIDAERFDATIRSRLTSFFRRALAKDEKARFPSAEVMRTEWVACFAMASWTDEADSSELPRAASDLSRLTAETPVGALPLSAREKNAIDRMGMVTLGELLSMPHNRLSATKGIGRNTSQKILEFLAEVRKVVEARPGPSSLPVFPDYAGVDGSLGYLEEIRQEVSHALDYAGLGTLASVASAPRDQVERILAAYPGALKHLVEVLEKSHQAADKATGAPTNLEDWLALFRRPPRSKKSRFPEHAEQYLGLAPVPGAELGERCGDASWLARKLGQSRASIHAALGKAREVWAKNPFIAELHSGVWAVLDRLGGVASVPRLAGALLAEIPHKTGSAPGAGPDRIAEAVVRIAVETDPRFIQGRIHRCLWLAQVPEHLSLVKDLGALADELASREPLPSAEEVSAALARVVEGTPLAGLASERLVALAAEASRGAARSARLELYPQGLEARRAVALSASALSSATQVTPDKVQRLVRARYPEAEAPPGRPALDELLSPLGLVWDDEKRAYTRPGKPQPTSVETRDTRRLPTIHTGAQPNLASRESREARDFEDLLRLAMEKRNFKVLDVSSGRDGEAVDSLVRHFHALHLSLEKSMLEEVDRLMSESKVNPAVVVKADRDGPSSGMAWENLRKLMRRAAAAVLARLKKAGKERPVVLSQPGLLARYDLVEEAHQLVDYAQQDDAPSILLVNPTDQNATPATIDGPFKPLPVPVISKAQQMRVPKSWLDNLHRGGAD